MNTSSKASGQSLRDAQSENTRSHVRTSQTVEKEESVRTQIYLTQTQREWLKRKAYEEDSKMSNVLRALIDEAMSEEG